MKYLFLIITLVWVSFASAQAFKGKEDQKFQVGATIQNNGTGLNLSYDYGIGENISLGLSSTYLLGVEEKLDADFSNRFDLKARFNANIGNVLNISEKFDLYPGLSLSFNNFGGHLGARYFFTDGFGIYTELNTPFAIYDNSLTPAEKLNNQFTVNIGASFNL